MANISGTNLAAPIAPFTDADTYPTHEAKYGKGGYRSVATLTDRDNIPAQRREAGMMVLVVSDGKKYILASDLTTWGEEVNTSTATNISVSTTGFTNNLTSAENTVQKALDKLDDLVIISQVRLDNENPAITTKYSLVVGLDSDGNTVLKIVEL